MSSVLREATAATPALKPRRRSSQSPYLPLLDTRVKQAKQPKGGNGNTWRRVNKALDPKQSWWTALAALITITK